MKVEYWGVGNTAATPLNMTIQEISAYLLADWVPSLPVSVSSSFVGWPPFLMELVSFNNNDHLTLRKEAGKSERQWKGVLSWMIGVAGARHVLKTEGYRWIAPLSAFYQNPKHQVDLTAWHTSFPPGVIVATGAPGSASHLRPDYLALRRLSNCSPLEWAVVEAKGTDDCLTNRIKCPQDWYDQARNIQIKMNGTIIPIPRHLVVATRANPNAVRSVYRRLQIRSWNSQRSDKEPLLPQNAVADIATAHLFGLFRNLRLQETSKALAHSIQCRAHAYKSSHVLTKRIEVQRLLLKSADEELKQETKATPTGDNLMTSAIKEIETDFGTISIEIDSATMSLIRTLINPGHWNLIPNMLEKTDKALDDRGESERLSKTKDNKVYLPSGVTLTYPRNLFKDEFFKRG